MNQAEHLKVGYIQKAHGLRGQLYLRLFSGKADWAENMKGAELSFRRGDEVRVMRLTYHSPHKEGFIVSCEGINDRDQAEEVKGFELSIPRKWLVSAKGESIYLQEIEGFELFDEKLGWIGVIEGFSHSGAQDLLEVSHEGQTRLVPIVAELISELDFPNRILRMNLPEGLLEV